MSKAITKSELRGMFLVHCCDLVDYWVNCDHEGAKTTREKVEGVLFSVLVAIDGSAGGFPCALDLVARPHPEDKDFMMEEDEDYVEDGQVLNDGVQLHSEFGRLINKQERV